MKKIDYLHNIDVVNSLFLKIRDFKELNHISEGAAWDMFHIYWYYLKTSEPISYNKLSKLRYGYRTSVQAIKTRVLVLADRGMVTKTNRGKILPTQKAISDIRAILDISVEDLSKIKHPASVLKPEKIVRKKKIDKQLKNK